MKRRYAWLPLILLVAASLACTTPSLPFADRTVRGSGNVIVEERAVSGFDRVDLTGFGRVIITQGGEESLTIETDDNLMQYIETKVTGSTLELGFTDEDKIPDPRDSIIFRLNVVDLTAVSSSGAGKFEIAELDTDELGITLGGAGDIKIDALSSTDLDVTINGAGNIELAGQVERQVVTLNGLGNYTAKDLESQTTTVVVAGAGSIGVWAVDTLDVTISGAGNVDYYGSPDVTQNITGLGKLTSRGDR